MACGDYAICYGQLSQRNPKKFRGTFQEADPVNRNGPYYPLDWSNRFDGGEETDDDEPDDPISWIENGF
jgi:hypothetical protein